MRRLVTLVVLLLAVGPRAGAGSTVTTVHHTFGQAPAFLRDGRVVSAENFGDGQQIYVANIDGSHRRCLTCGQSAPNGVPQPRPTGGWILYHSWTGEYITFGSPGFGGIGSQLWVMRTDGTRRTQLTGTDPANGGEGEDNYHAYWSPDGKQIVWAHLNWNFVNNNGSGKWDVRVARFVVDRTGRPRLTDTRVVRPANGHWYETQWWSPDGSGFLYTETWGSAMNTELFFCRLTARGCLVRRLTDNPAWDEQAIFTPDGRDVIFMSTRDRPGFYNTFSTLAADSGVPTDLDYLLVLPVFEAGFEQPAAQESTDLYELDLARGSVRRLTTDGNDGWVIPEFTWDPTNSFLMWTELRLPNGVRAQLPPDPASQLAGAAQYAADPQLPSVGFNRLELLPLEKRTRIGRFLR
jgi:Tol biopolymer transport system component